MLGDEKADSVTASFFGDGTCNVGQFYECLNMAALYKLPHIFVVENNLWAIGMSHQRATANNAGDEEPHIYKKVWQTTVLRLFAGLFMRMLLATFVT